MADLKTFLLDYTGKIQQGLNGFLLNFPFLVPTIWNDKVLRYKKKTPVHLLVSKFILFFNT